MKRILTKLSTAALAIAGLLLVVGGCTTERSPVTSDNAAATGPVSEGRTSLLVFSAPKAASIAGIEVGEDAQGDADDTVGWPITVSDEIGPTGGMLTITAESPDQDRLRIVFQVPSQSLEEKWDIAMTVKGAMMLSGLQVAFSPDGLEFPKPAALQITLEEGLINVPMTALTNLVILHYDGDGDLIETIEPNVKFIGNGTVIIDLLIHGFSVYSLPPGR